MDNRGTIDLIREIQQEHADRLDIPQENLKSRKFMRRPTPNTAIICEAIARKRKEMLNG